MIFKNKLKRFVVLPIILAFSVIAGIIIFSENYQEQIQVRELSLDHEKAIDKTGNYRYFQVEYNEEYIIEINTDYYKEYTQEQLEKELLNDFEKNVIHRKNQADIPPKAISWPTQAK